jgi:DNA-directed RNA polymerase specialized sigma24 family protein
LDFRNLTAPLSSERPIHYQLLIDKAGNEKMRIRKNSISKSDNGADFAVTRVLDRIAKILAMSVVHSSKREEQVSFLHSVGYTPAEVASFLDIPSNAVSVILYQRKKKAYSP